MANLVSAWARWCCWSISSSWAAIRSSCHSLRHLVGGMFDVLSRRPIRKKMYDCVSCLNRRHMLFAWMSLFWVAFSDLYVRMCSMGIWTDWRIF